MTIGTDVAGLKKFLADTVALTALKQAIANVHGVLSDAVKFSISAVRRLALGHDRPLVSVSALVDYVIVAPASSGLHKTAEAVSSSALTTAIQQELAAGGISSYGIVVTENSAVTNRLHTTTTSHRIDAPSSARHLRLTPSIVTLFLLAYLA